MITILKLVKREIPEHPGCDLVKDAVPLGKYYFSVERGPRRINGFCREHNHKYTVMCWPVCDDGKNVGFIPEGMLEIVAQYPPH